MKQKGPPWPAKARAEKHASAFSLARAVSHFFLFFDFSSSSSPLSLSAALLDRSSVRTAARALAQALVRGQERACFREFPSSQRLFFFSVPTQRKTKKLQASSTVAAAAAAACCSFAPSSSSRLASFSAQPSRGFAAGASTTDLTSEIEHATGLER